MDLSAVFTPALSDYHLFRRPLHGSLHRSCIAEVYPTLELICEFRPSKFSHYPSRPVPLPEVFVTTRPDPVPKSKTTTRQSLAAIKAPVAIPMQFSAIASKVGPAAAGGHQVKSCVPNVNMTQNTMMTGHKESNLYGLDCRLVLCIITAYLMFVIFFSTFAN